MALWGVCRASTRPDPSLDVETMDTTVDTDYAYAKAPKKTEPLNLEHAWESDNEYTTTEEDIDPETYVMDNEYKPSEDPLTSTLRCTALQPLCGFVS